MFMFIEKNVSTYYFSLGLKGIFVWSLTKGAYVVRQF